MINTHSENSFASKRMKQDNVYEVVDPLFDHAQKLQKRNSILEHVIRQMDADNQVLLKANKRLSTSWLTLAYLWIKNKLSFMWSKKDTHDNDRKVLFDTKGNVFAGNHLRTVSTLWYEGTAKSLVTGTDEIHEAEKNEL